VVSLDEAYCGFCFVGNYDSWCASKSGSDTSMGRAVSPGLVLGFRRYLVGGAGCGMSPLFLPLSSSPE
jgi:hypothetical protein